MQRERPARDSEESSMQSVFVLDQAKQPLMPCHAARARKLLKGGKAAVYLRYPFTIILKERLGGEVEPASIKVDPGSKQTGIAVVAEREQPRVVFAAEVEHRKEAVHNNLLGRSQLRRSRRSRKTRYRQPRFTNRRRAKGWLPPSVRSVVNNVETMVKRLQKLCPASRLVQALIKFDTQQMQNAEISGIEYQQGTLQGYEVRAYLLEKWHRMCAYCGETNVPLEIEHLIPQSRGGSDRVSNLTIACHACNQRKGSLTAAEFGCPRLQAQAKQPLKDAAVLNVSRWALYERLLALGLPVEVSSGGRTKFNRVRQAYPKAHWIDAACVGEHGGNVALEPDQPILRIKATGRGSRQMCRMDKFGFPRTSAKAAKRVHGFQTGDRVKAVVPSGKKAGTYVGRVAVRFSGRFAIQQAAGLTDGIGYRHCHLVQRSDGYHYQGIHRKEKGAFLPSPEGRGFLRQMR